MSTGDETTAREIIAGSLSKPSTGRVYDYLLGGKHNYAIDRKFVDEIFADLPEGKICAQQNRGFVRRATRLAREFGIDQFIDIGSGLPTQGNVHEIADETDNASHVVYIDNDPIALAHAEILLADTADPQRHHALDGDFNDGRDLWSRIMGSGYIDPQKPVCLIISAMLHFIESPDTTMAFYRDQVAPGSLLAISHATDEDTPPAVKAAAAKYVATTSSAWLRPKATIKRYFGDWELLPPGLVWTPQWRPDLLSPDERAFTGVPASALAVCGLAQKPQPAH